MTPGADDRLVFVRCPGCRVSVRVPARAPYWRVPCCPLCGAILFERLTEPYSMSYCKLCGGSDPRRDRRLLNGAIFHEDCVRRVDELARARESEAERLARALRSRVARWLTFGPGTRRIGKDATDARLHRLRTSAAYLANLRDDYYDLWPTYPPDWRERQAAVRERAGHRCERCGKPGRPLHTHHKVPRHQGGNHRLDNLVVLCEECHRRQHRHPFGFAEVEDANPPHEHMFKVELIARALREGRLLHFLYTRRDGARSERSVEPTGIVLIGGAEYLTGYCYLRSAERVFSIARMSHVTIVQRPGRCRDL